MNKLEILALERTKELLDSFDTYNIRRPLTNILYKHNIPEDVINAIRDSFDESSSIENKKIREAQKWVDTLLPNENSK